MKLEKDFQSKLIKRLRSEIPDATVFKTDPTQAQGFPDLLVLSHGKFAALEVKRASKSSRRPNQGYYVDKINKEDGFASFISPENEDEVVQQTKSYFKEE